MTLLHNQISQSLLCVSQWKKHLFAQKALNSKAIGRGSSAPSTSQDSEKDTHFQIKQCAAQVGAEKKLLAENSKYTQRAVDVDVCRCYCIVCSSSGCFEF